MYTSNRGVVLLLTLLIITVALVINLYGDTGNTLPDIILTTEETTTTTTSTTEETTTTSTTESETTTITTTTITKITTIDETKEPDYIWFDTEKMMAHNNYNCPLLDKNNAEKIYYYMGLKYVKEGCACPECGQDITVGQEYKCAETLVPEIEYMTYYGGKKHAEYGSSGRQLIGCYSVASNIIPEGTYVRIKSENGSINGLFRVDDCGCANNVIDIYFHDYVWVPEPFKTNGKVKCKVWIIEEE
jgi:hypothetical protein